MSAVIHRCPDCGHPHDHHSKLDGARCSMGACRRCVRSQDEVEAAEPPETIPTWPGYDHATNKWAVR